jgi:hypothetical protein
MRSRRQVGDERAERDRHQQQRFEALDDGQIEQDGDHHPHHDHLPLQVVEAGVEEHFLQVDESEMDIVMNAG